jgi:hypothetical protein
MGILIEGWQAFSAVDRNKCCLLIVPIRGSHVAGRRRGKGEQSQQVDFDWSLKGLPTWQLLSADSTILKWK